MSVATKERVRAALDVTIGRDALLAVVARLRGVVDRRSTIPILNNLKLEVADGRLNVTGTDLDIEVTDSAPCAGEGATTVSAEQLGGLLAKMPAGAECTLTLASGEGRLTLKCGRSSYRLNVLPATDFPVISGGSLGPPIVMDTNDLETLIDKTAFAISTESTRFYLCGAYLHAVTVNGRSMLRTVATDGHRLALADIDAPDGYDAPGVNVPSKTIREIGRLLDVAGETVSVRVSAQKIQIAGGSWVLTSKVIDGDYPPYQRVIPAENPRSATLDRKALIAALDRLQVIAGDKSKAVRLEFGEGPLRIRLRNIDDSGEGVEEVECAFDGAPLNVGVNAGLLLGILAHIDDNNVELRLAEADLGGTVTTSPALVLDPSNEHVRYVLVPLRA